MSAVELMAKVDRTHEESEELVKALLDVLKKSSLLCAHYHRAGLKTLKSRSKDELGLLIGLQNAISKLSQ